MIKVTQTRNTQKNENSQDYYSNDSYKLFIPANELNNYSSSEEDGSYGSHLFHDSLGRFYDNPSYDSMD